MAVVVTASAEAATLINVPDVKSVDLGPRENGIARDVVRNLARDLTRDLERASAGSANCSAGRPARPPATPAAKLSPAPSCGSPSW
ncbi:hypothetical protein [Saccharopolyspora gloriosae]|uniref:hypothetical protein n=1 Tax=Saccharopolyspora gloriosae TaxID=455344 RepID=UPI001FB80A6D|nr:hypothetical protein [Saccharopolyspora gloriosae]